MKKYILFSIIFFGVLFFANQSAQAATSISSCQTLSQAGEYTLTQDVSSSGTCFAISGSGVILDLGGHTVTYNTGSAGPGIHVSGSNDVVKNGTVVQGNAKSTGSEGILVSDSTSMTTHQTSGNELHHLVVRVNGIQVQAVRSFYSDVAIHHSYLESHTTTDCQRGEGIETAFLENRNGGGAPFYDNILVGGHSGVVMVGGSNATNLYNNLIQQERRPGCKAPYGIGLSWKISNVNVYNNQIISDNGRGIILDGWAQVSPPTGSTHHNIHDNRIDAQYSTAAKSGYYVENAIYGIRDRYSSGNNIFENNTVITTNLLDGYMWGFFIGSDSADSDMIGIQAKNNTIIARKGNGAYPLAFSYDHAQDISVTGNKYFTDGAFSGYAFGENNVYQLTESGNTPITPTSYTPAAPTGLTITKFYNSYLLRWDDNLAKGETQTYEYIVYRDGQKLPISPRGGTFYVDVEPGGVHTYQVSALNLAGTEGQKSASVSSAQAINGWWSGNTPPPDTTPPSCVYTYSNWSACQSNSAQSRTVVSSSPTGCTGTPSLTQSCVYVPTQNPCAYTYSDWGNCQSNNTQTRTVISLSPSGCIGTPSLTQSCVYAPSPGDITTGLIGYWKFDETSGVTAVDSSGNNNNGALFNSPTRVAGKLGQALSFDGADDYVNAGSGSSLDDLGPMTISAWIYPKSGGEGGTGIIVTKRTDAETSNGDFRFGFNSAAARQLVFEKGYSTTILQRFSGWYAYLTNTWQHVVMTWDGSATASNVKFYVNGSEFSYGTTQNGVGTKNSDVGKPLLIGSDIWTTRTFDGLIDEVRVYNRALSPNEISQLYNYTGFIDTTPPSAPTGVTII